MDWSEAKPARTLKTVCWKWLNLWLENHAYVEGAFVDRLEIGLTHNLSESIVVQMDGVFLFVCF